MKSHFKKRLPIYSIGPLLPPGFSRHSLESSESESKKGQMERDVQEFLNKMQAQYGERSVIFVGLFLIFGRTPQTIMEKKSDLFWDDFLAYVARVH